MSDYDNNGECTTILTVKGHITYIPGRLGKDLPPYFSLFITAINSTICSKVGPKEWFGVDNPTNAKTRVFSYSKYTKCGKPCSVRKTLSGELCARPHVYFEQVALDNGDFIGNGQGGESSVVTRLWQVLEGAGGLFDGKILSKKKNNNWSPISDPSINKDLLLSLITKLDKRLADVIDFPGCSKADLACKTCELIVDIV